MFTTRVIDEKEKDRYNAFVIHHPRGHFLQLWEWGQVKEGMGWEKLPLVLEEDGEIKASLLEAPYRYHTLFPVIIARVAAIRSPSCSAKKI